MAVETKFDIGNTVFFLSDKKIEFSEVRKITTIKEKSEDVKVFYELENQVDIGGFFFKFYESEIFATKEELINSL